MQIKKKLFEFGVDVGLSQLICILNKTIFFRQILYNVNFIYKTYIKIKIKTVSILILVI